MTEDRAVLARLRIEPLDRKKHDRGAFSCGVATIDAFIKTLAAQQQDVDSTRVYVACLDRSNEIVGFYAVNSHAIDVSLLPPALRKKLPRHPTIGAVYLSMVGVSASHQGAGIGRYLLGDALKRAAQVAEQIGVAFVVLDALSERAAVLYRRLGFQDLVDPPSRMIIGMRQVRAAIERA